MDKIIHGVYSEIVNLASTHAKSGEKIVTERLISDFKHALISILQGEILIRDLDQSKELREDAIKLFKEKDIPEDSHRWPYFGQLKEQDRCFACGKKFLLGETVHRFKLCGHFACEKHKEGECAPCKKAEKAKQQDEEKRVLGKINEKNSDGEQGKQVKQEEKQDEQDEQDEQDQKARKALFLVEDITNFSPQDFKDSKDAVIQEASLFQIQMKDGRVLWFSTNDYQSMKFQIANERSKEDEQL